MAKYYGTNDKFLKRTMKESLYQVLDEVKPVILEKTTERVKNRLMTKADKQSALSDAMVLFERNASLWHGLLNRRKEIQFKLTRAGSLLSLYKEGLSMNPVFVPQKFRQEQGYATSRGTLDQMHASNVQSFESEVANVELKIAEYKKEIKKIDEEILHKASLMSTDPTVVEAITRMIQERIVEHTYRIEKECEIRAKERREAFQKDIFKYDEKLKHVKYECLKNESLGRKIDKDGNFVQREEHKKGDRKERYTYEYGDDRTGGIRDASKERYSYQHGNKWGKIGTINKDDVKLRYSYEFGDSRKRDVPQKEDSKVSKSYENGDFKRRYTYENKENKNRDLSKKEDFKTRKSYQNEELEERNTYKKEEHKGDVPYNPGDYRSKLCRFNDAKRVSGRTRKEREKEEEQNLNTNILERQKHDAEQVLKKAEYLAEKYGSTSTYPKRDFVAEKRMKYQEKEPTTYNYQKTVGKEPPSYNYHKTVEKEPPSYNYHKTVAKEVIKDDILKSLTSINQRIDALEKGTSYSNSKDEPVFDSRTNIDKTIESVEQDLKYRAKRDEGLHNLRQDYLSSPVKNVKDESTLTQFSGCEPIKSTQVQVKNAIVTDSEYEGPRHESRYKYYQPSDKTITEDTNIENYPVLPCNVPFSEKRISSETNIDSRYKFSTFAERNIDEIYKYNSERNLPTRPYSKEYEDKGNYYTFENEKNDNFIYNDSSIKDKVISESPIKDITNTIDKIIHRMNTTKEIRDGSEENTLYKTTTVSNLDRNIEQNRQREVNNTNASLPERPLKYTNKITSSSSDNHIKEESLSRWDNREEINLNAAKDYSDYKVAREQKSRKTPERSRKIYTSYSEEKFRTPSNEGERLGNGSLAHIDMSTTQSLQDIVSKPPTVNRQTDRKRINGVDVGEKEKMTYAKMAHNAQHTQQVNLVERKLTVDKGRNFNDLNSNNVDIVLKVNNDKIELNQENEPLLGSTSEKVFNSRNTNSAYISQSAHNISTQKQSILEQKHSSLESINKIKDVTSVESKETERELGYSCEFLSKNIKPADVTEPADDAVSLNDSDIARNERVVKSTARRSRKSKKNVSSDESRKRSQSCSDITITKQKNIQKDVAVAETTSLLGEATEVVVLHTEGTQKEVEAAAAKGRSRFLRYTGKESAQVEVRSSKRIVRVDNGCLAQMNPEYVSATSGASTSAKRTGYVASPRYKRRTIASHILGSFGLVHK